MQYIQILDCSSTLGTCCSDYGLVTLLDITRKIFDLVQLFVPIILLVMATVSFIKLIANPTKEKGLKKIINQFLAAVIIFFIPTMLNVVLNMLPDTVEIAACWDTAKVHSEVIKAQTSKYVSPTNREVKPLLIDSSEYEKGNAREPGGSGNGSATGKAIVQYARQFVGKPYVYGGSWNGELPYTGTDCSGFVKGVFSHFGIKLSRTTDTQWADTSKYTIVSESNIKAGDVIMYYGHVGILTGNGAETIHASNPRDGVKITADYRYRSVRGIMRINGVN